MEIQNRNSDAREPLLDEAAAWIARLRATNVSQEDRRRFSEWLERSGAHREAFDTMADLWTGLGALDTDPLQAAPAPWRQPLAWGGALAATVAAVALSLVLLGSGEVYRTDVGEQRQQLLADGSVLWLNTASEVVVDFDDERRSLHLEMGGELYVQVARDPERPLVVSTSHGTARAIGTAFSVRATDSRMNVAVREGTVAVQPLQVAPQAGPAPVLVVEGQHVHTSAGMPIGEISALEGDPAAWRSGRVVYDDVPLQDLVADLSRYLPTRLTIVDDDLADMRVTAVLYLEDQNSMLEALTRVLPVRWVKLSEQVVLIHPA